MPILKSRNHSKSYFQKDIKQKKNLFFITSANFERQSDDLLTHRDDFNKVASTTAEIPDGLKLQYQTNTYSYYIKNNGKSSNFTVFLTNVLHFNKIFLSSLQYIRCRLKFLLHPFH